MDALIAKKAEVMARLASMKLPGGASAAPVPTPVPVSTLPVAAASTFDKIAVINAQIQAKLTGQIPTVALTQLKELHPMLRNDYKASAQSGQAPMPHIFSIKANQCKEQPKRLKIEHEAPTSFTDPKKNPYFDTSLGAHRTAGPRARRAGKQFQFAKPGQYSEQADKLRNEAKMEQIKVEISARAEVARLEDEVLDANAIKFSEPPEIEWWDAPFVSNGAYPQGNVVLVESLITIYVQHLVPVEPPASILNKSSAPPSQPMLTHNERKKLRRQRRIEKQHEHCEKVMLGLLPPDEPKLRMSNFMRIMANQSVLDPTKAEAKARKQKQARVDKHKADNQARKLSKEQRVAKKKRKVEIEEQKGMVAAVFRVDNLRYPQHRYKVSVGAKENYLTGRALFCEHLSVVVVEGSERSVKAYKKLMLRRIDWVNAQVKLDAASSAGDVEQPEVDFSKNSCHMIWQGPIERPRFSEFRLRDCSTEGDAKSALGDYGCEAYWQLAKQFDTSATIASDLLL
ncbi:U4/U5/U6 small nuclear ribonucleoprotein prp3 [Coemansia furcata]|uniref:U4/U5/U6 small nuclear ribonucleoprotein prp3 n=1 Tax=Coemansia furcata TaxID=417177 RepID=A0ACC1LM96_9FUNG|nr:U4/U5/U6 small nuclear ribonucleoprotein prp3 [Coemansia furcata]